MIRGRWFKHGIRMKPFHYDLINSEYEHVGSCESTKSVHEETDELEATCDDAPCALRQFIQVSFRVCPEVEETHE